MAFTLEIWEKVVPLHSQNRNKGSLAQLNRAFDYGSKGYRFESYRSHFFCGNSSVGRAQPCQGWGRGSESRFPLNILKQQEFCFEYGVFENGEVAELVDALL